LYVQEVQQIDAIAGAELKWLAKAYGKETEELKVRQGMDWREWEKAKRKVSILLAPYIREATCHGHHTLEVQTGMKQGAILFMVSEALLFQVS
jgi:hypothetical protein